MEVLAHFLNEYFLGYGKRIEVCLHPDGSISITSQCRGLETELDPIFQRPIAELRVGTLNYGMGAYQCPRFGLFAGVDANCVNAVSEWMSVETRNGQGTFSMAFARGELAAPLKQVSSNELGTSRLTIRFKPDPQIFKQHTFNYVRLAWRCEEACFLTPGLVIAISDLREFEAPCRCDNTFYFPQGLANFVQRRLDPCSLAHPMPITFENSEAKISIEAAIQFCRTDQRCILNYLNLWPAFEGGAHVHGFLAGVRSSVEALFQQKPPAPYERIVFENIDRGFVAVLKVNHPSPHFNGATRDRVVNPELFEIVKRLTENGVRQFMAENPSVKEWLLRHFYRNRELDQNWI